MNISFSPVFEQTDWQTSILYNTHGKGVVYKCSIRHLSITYFEDERPYKYQKAFNKKSLKKLKTFEIFGQHCPYKSRVLSLLTSCPRCIGLDKVEEKIFTKKCGQIPGFNILLVKSPILWKICTAWISPSQHHTLY